MALEAGTITGKLRIDLSDLSRLQSEAKQTGQVMRTELGGKIIGGVTPESIQNTKTAAAELKKLGAASGAASNEIRASSKAGADSLTALGGSAKNVETALGGATTAARSLASALGVGLSVAGLIQFTRGVVDAAVATERITNALKAVTGSSATAAAEFNFVKEQAKRMGLDLQSAAQQYTGLTAASKGTALQGEETRRIFLAVTDAAAVLGLSADQAGGALLAIQQMISKGNVSAEELRGQLGERLPGAFQLAARAMGVTTQQLDKMLVSGQITAADMLPKLATELNKTFGPGVAAAMASTQASMNRLSTAWFEFKTAIADSGVITGMVWAFDQWAISIGAVGRAIDRVKGAFGFLSGTVIKDQIRNIDETMKALRDTFQQMDKGAKTPTIEAALKANIERRNELAAERARLEQSLGTAGALMPKGPPSSPTAGKDDDKATKKLQSALDSYRESLIKTITQQEIEEVKLTMGEQAALQASQAYQVLGLRASLAADKLPIPPELGASAVAAEATLRKLGANVEILGEKSFAKLQAGALAGAAGLEALKFQMERIVEIGQAMSQDSAEWLNVDVDLAKVSEDRKKQLADLNELRQQLQLGAMDTSTPAGKENQRIATIEVDFVKTANRIEELGRAAGATQEQIAADIALAWKKAANEIGKAANEVAQRWANAFEGIGDALLDAVNALSDGGKLKDVGARLAQSINSALTKALVTDPIKKWIQAQADEIAKGGGLGGLLGGILGGGKSTPDRSNEVIDRADAARGREIAADVAGASPLGGAAAIGSDQAAIAAIQAQSAAANTSLQAISTGATTAIQAEATTAQTGLQALSAEGTAAINAVLQAALAAIEAAKAAASSSGGGMGGLPGMDMMGGMFGGGSSTGLSTSTGGGSVGGALAGSSFSGGEAAASSGWLDALMSLFSFTHEGGEIGGQLRSLHDAGGLKANERMIIAEVGEVVFSKESVRSIGKEKLLRANIDGALPKMHGGGDIADLQVPKFHGGGAWDAGNASFGLTVPKFHDGGYIFAGDTRLTRELGRDMPKFNPPGSSVMAMQQIPKAAVPTVNNFNFSGVSDMESYRRSKGEIMADLRSATRRSEEYD